MPLPTPLGMTTSTPAIHAWATRPLGKAARISMAALGMVMSTLVLTGAAVVDSGSWALVILGVALATTSVRAAHVPNTSRLLTLTAVAVAIPLSLQIF